MDQDQLLFEQNPTPMLIYEVETLQILKVNDAARQKYGYTDQEFTRLTIEDIRPDEDLDSFDNRINEIDADFNQERLVRHITREGACFYAQINSHSFSYTNSDARLVAVYDITEEVNARIKAEEAYRELDHLIKKNPLATIKWDQDRRVEEWSAGAEKISGYSKQEVLGKTMNELDLFPQQVQNCLVEQIRHFPKEQAIEKIETQIQVKDGATRDIRIHASVLCNDTDKAQSLLTMVEDITETKEAERRLSRQNEIIRFINDLSTSIGNLDNFNTALEEAVERICKFINWPVGHVYKRSGEEHFESTDIWYLKNSNDYETFVHSAKVTDVEPGKGFLGKSVEQELPTILKDIGNRDHFLRETGNRQNGLQMCFALPITVGDETTVILEFLCEEVVQPDELFLDMLGAVENQLGRILERIQAREKLELSERKYRRLFERANDGIFIMDEEQFIDCNSQVEELFNCTRDDIVGTTPFKFSPDVQPNGEKSVDKGLRHIHKALDGTPQVFQWKHKTKDGKLIDTEVSLNSIQLEDGTYLQAIVRDITKQKEAENALKRSEELFRNLFLRAPVAMVMVNHDNTVKMVNNTFQELFGYAEEELVGKDIDRIIVPEDKYEKAPKMPRGDLNGNDYIREYTRITKKGEELDVLIGSIPVYLEEEPLAGFGIYIDISEQKNTQRQLENSVHEKEVLLSEIHHRVKNNLAVVSALLELQVLREESTHVSELLEDSLLRIKTMALVHETLYKTENFANLKLNNYIEKLVRYNTSAAQAQAEKVDVITEIEDFDLNINQAIPCALIINELISNAYKYAFKDKKKGKLKIILNQEEDTVHLLVEDDGIGLPQDFEKLKQASMGMTLIQQLVDQLDGKLSIRSNGGTKIELRFSRHNKPGSASHFFA